MDIKKSGLRWIKNVAAKHDDATASEARHVHRTKLADCSPRDIATTVFINGSPETRRSVFGLF